MIKIWVGYSFPERVAVRYTGIMFLKIEIIFEENNKFHVSASHGTQKKLYDKSGI